jgi:hypothetical protein
MPIHYRSSTCVCPGLWSSVLATKAAGYPLALIAAKLGLGIPHDEMKNLVRVDHTRPDNAALARGGIKYVLYVPTSVIVAVTLCTHFSSIYSTATAKSCLSSIMTMVSI